MEVDDIISYHDVVTAEKASLQKGMNFGVGKKYSIFLMSLRENAPYADALDLVTGMLTYEGHDEPQRRGGPNPKDVDQPLLGLIGGSNGLLFWYDRGELSPAEIFLRDPQAFIENGSYIICQGTKPI